VDELLLLAHPQSFNICDKVGSFGGSQLQSKVPVQVQTPLDSLIKFQESEQPFAKGRSHPAADPLVSVVAFVLQVWVNVHSREYVVPIGNPSSSGVVAGSVIFAHIPSTHSCD